MPGEIAEALVTGGHVSPSQYAQPVVVDGFGEETVVKVLKESLRPTYFEMNRRAFELGKEGYVKALGK